ncbi:MAG: M56 family metallopeptidase [Oscillospiraceae bacterium]|nr:M56 family metallopeptidase [Oscillospiraceae bacterium]
MDDVFLKLVNLSISASWLILAVLVLRVVLKKAPKWVMPLLWGVVALRLVCLFSIESALSLIPSAETIPSEIVTETREPVLYEQATLDIVTNPTLPSAAEVPVGVSRQQAQVDFNIYSVLWLAGMAALLVHALVSAGKLKKKLATAILLRDNIYESEFVDSPFVFGVIKPKIYLPMHMDEGTAAYVIAHEHAHLARRDHWWKVLGYLVLALHWFNPLVWVAYILFCRDIELACDEKVVKGLDGAARADYSQALLSCAAPGRAVAACPLAFGEGNIKTRVKSALHYKKPAFWVAAAAVLAVVIMAVCFLTNPRSDIDAETLLGTSRGEITRISVKMGEADSGEEYRMSTEEIKTVLSLLDAAEYERLGSASAMQECYARLYFEGAAGERELMLSQGEVLANPIKGNQKAQLYGLRSGGTVLKNYVKWCVDRNDPTVPEDIAQQVERLICGMPLGNYLFGELVYDDPAWETSFSDNFSSTWPELRICCDSAFADFSAYTQMSAYVKDSGYYYRVSEWEEIDLTVSNFDWLFRNGSGEDWDGTSAAKLRRENAHAWRGTRTGEDVNATVPMAEIRRQDELTAMDQWLLLQQKDGSLYLVMGYRSGGLPYSGAHPYRWIVRLNGGATELTRADLNGDGIEEVISYTGTSTQEPYRLRVSNQSGEELWSAELGLAHVGWSSYFLYRDSVKTALLRYEPTIYQGEASYSYELFMLSENGTTTLAENSVSFSVNSDSADPWPAEARKFADEVNRLLDKSELLFSTLNAELHSYGDGTVIRCAEPSESDGSRALASADLDNDGRAEQIICEKAFGGYELCVVDDNGEELMRDRMSEGDVYFLCRENGRDMLLLYHLIEGKYQGRSSYYGYYYGLYTYDGGSCHVVENANAGIYLNPTDGQNGEWGKSEEAFAARVNALIAQSEFLVAWQDGELILTSEVYRWYCVSPRKLTATLDSTTVSFGKKSWDFAGQYPSLSGFEGSETVGNYLVVTGRLGKKNDLYVVFNAIDGTLLKTFPGNNLIWQGNDLSTAVCSYWSDVYALNGTKLAALDLASGEEISGLAFAADGVSIIATVSGKSGERKVTVTREGSAQQTSLTDWTEGDGAERTYFAPVGIEGNETFLATVGVSYRLEQQSDGTSRIAEITGAEGLTLPRYRRGWVSVDEKADVLDAVIADDGKSADVTVQYYASLGGSGYQPYTAVVHIVAP